MQSQKQVRLVAGVLFVLGVTAIFTTFTEAAPYLDESNQLPHSQVVAQDE